MIMYDVYIYICIDIYISYDNMICLSYIYIYIHTHVSCDTSTRFSCFRQAFIQKAWGSGLTEVGAMELWRCCLEPRNTGISSGC